MYSIISSVSGVTAFWLVIGIVLPFCVPHSPSRGCVKYELCVTNAQLHSRCIMHGSAKSKIVISLSVVNRNED